MSYHSLHYFLYSPSPEKQCLITSFDLTEISRLNFSRPDLTRFPCLSYAYFAGKTGGSMTVVLNAVNEIAVGGFLAGKIGYLDIARFIKEAMDGHKLVKNPDLSEILEIDQKVKEETHKKLKENNKT